jgi:GT2 family glycosyltransferase
MVRANFPQVYLLRNEVNHHYAFSNNRAMDIARGEYLLLLNNDTIVLPGALDAMLSFLREHPAAGAVGCKLLNADGSIQWSVKSLPNPGSAMFGARSLITRLFPNNRYSRKHLLHLDGDMSQPFVAGYVSSAAVMLPRRIAKEVGYLDVRLAYHVDADYCKRISDAGYKCYYLPTATIVHLNHRGGTMVSLRRRFHSLLLFHVQSYIFYRKHGGSAWSPVGILAVVGLTVRFVMSLTVQVGIELVALARRAWQAKGSMHSI